jgi:hypothetical protein
MATTAVATLKTAWDCKWSRPGYRLSGVPEQFQPETLWICTRRGNRAPVSDAKCETCEFWTEDETKEN